MKHALDLNNLATRRAKEAARIILDLKAAALSNVRDVPDAFAARELLQLALLATAAVDAVHNEDPSAYHDVAPFSEHWPVLFNEKADLTAYRSLRIGYQLLQSKNPRKRGAGSGMFAFLAKALIARLTSLRILAHLPEDFDAPVRHNFAQSLTTRQRHRNLADSGPDLPAVRLAELHARIDAYTPNWSRTLVSLKDFTTESASEWRKYGQKLFKEVFPKPETVPEFARLVLNPEDRKLGSVIRSRIIVRVGKAIVSAATGLEPEEQ
jgi:hypothetical protein